MENAENDAELIKGKLHWSSGFALTLGIITTGIFTSIGYTIGAVGVWGMLLIWAGAAVIGLLQVALYSEMALMFPDKTGGIGMYAHEAWRKYFSPIGPLCVYGYWMAWSLALAAIGLTLGELVKAQWFASSGTFFTIGSVHVGVQHFVAAAAIILVWLVNVIGIKLTVRLMWLLNAGAVVALVLFIVAPIFSGQWSASSFTFHFDGPWDGLKLAIGLIYVAGWSVYGTEIVATFSPEFRDTKRDVPKAAMSSGIFMLLAFSLAPIGAAGTVGEAAVTDNPVGYAVDAFEKIVGPASGLITAFICASMFASMAASTGDAGRALYGLAREGMTLKQLDHLSKRNGMPVRQMTIDLVINLAMVFFLGSTIAVLFASNFGYLLCTTFAVGGYILLRKDRPEWPRPLKLPRFWVGIAVIIFVIDAIVTIVGFLNPHIAGYGNSDSIVIALVLLSFGPITFVIRKKLQDRQKLRFRDEGPVVPDVADKAEVADPV
ncbi:APC family permease [Leekyejoonella antrihumi]|uniref:APC family permease n=1 Tax=Leekyejoonella antrihumi TaxID=1660198 RepID=A0A563DQR2_9MICO|nr:APC family permease [Leekyejoonella antrihumi]TWP32565.1 APC family permease [Leekyejoonella antrihumi]